MDLFKKLNDFILTITSRNENFWEQRQLGKQNKITMGQSPSSKNYTDNPKDWILIQGNADLKSGKVAPRIYTSQLTKKADIGDIILTVRAPVGEVAITDYDAVLGRGVAAIKGNLFIYFALEKFKANNKWNMYSSGSTFDSITGKDLNNLPLFFPSETEENKIGVLLNKLDNLLALYDRKLKLVKLIYKELENKVYNNDLIKQTNFTKVKLGEILKEKNIKSTYEDQYPVLSSTNSGIELRNGRTNSSSNVGYKVLSKNELVLSPQNLWLGNININFNFRNGLVSPSYKVFSLTNNINIIYLNSLLHHPKMMYLYKVVSVQGASVVRRNLDIEAFENLTLKLTSIEAQNKIGNLLNKNRQLIDSLEKKKDQISKIKTTLLNTMFI